METPHFPKSNWRFWYHKKTHIFLMTPVNFYAQIKKITQQNLESTNITSRPFVNSERNFIKQKNSDNLWLATQRKKNQFHLQTTSKLKNIFVNSIFSKIWSILWNWHSAKIHLCTKSMGNWIRKMKRNSKTHWRKKKKKNWHTSFFIILHNLWNVKGILCRTPYLLKTP